MEITSVNIKVVQNEAPVRAYCSIVFNNCFVVRKIRVIEKNDKFQVYMPSMKTKRDVYADVCHPTNQQFRKKIECAVLNNYFAMLKTMTL